MKSILKFKKIDFLTDIYYYIFYICKIQLYLKENNYYEKTI